MVIMTNDSPWGEAPNEIIADMVRACFTLVKPPHAIGLLVVPVFQCI